MGKNKDIKEKDRLEITIETRASDYGDFGKGAEAIADMMVILDELHIDRTGIPLTEVDRANLNYILIKLVRLGAQPEHLDSWHDMQGYSKRIEDYYANNTAIAALEKAGN